MSTDYSHFTNKSQYFSAELLRLFKSPAVDCEVLEKFVILK